MPRLINERMQLLKMMLNRMGHLKIDTCFFKNRQTYSKHHCLRIQY